MLYGSSSAMFSWLPDIKHPYEMMQYVSAPAQGSCRCSENGRTLVAPEIGEANYPSGT